VPNRFDRITRVLRTRIQLGLHTGSLREGDRLPTARELGREFGIDARTALRAVRCLEADGVVEIRSRSGIYVAIPGSTPCALSPLQSIAVEVLVSAHAEGVPPRELREVLEATFYHRRIRVACGDTNMDHAEAVASMASATFGVDAVPTPLAALAEEGPDNSAATCQIILTTSFLDTDVRNAAKPFGRPVFVAPLRRATS
jgi:DNA-binding transcriptional regulator YhcF (GntR family)